MNRLTIDYQDHHHLMLMREAVQEGTVIRGFLYQLNPRRGTQTEMCRVIINDLTTNVTHFVTYRVYSVESPSRSV